MAIRQGMKSEDISQETVRTYLIGNLDEATIESLDELSIADQGFAERIAAEQYDLVDDWVAGRLDHTERAAFGLVLARSPTLVQRVNIARLMAATPRVAVVERSAAPGFFAALFRGFPRPAYVLGGLALLIGVAVTALMLVRQDSTSELAQVSPIASESPTPSASIELPTPPEPTPDAAPINTSPRSGTSANRPSPSPEPSRRTSPLFATLILAPPTRGDSSIRSVALKPGVEFLALTIQTEAESSGRYIIDVGDPSGKSDWRSQAIRGRSVNGRTAVSVRIPAASLKSGFRSLRLLDAAAGSEVLDEHVVKIER